MSNYDLTVNRGYSQSELSSIFQTNFGNRMKGITPRKPDNTDPYIIICSRANGPYTDRIDGDTFYYDGEGLNRDQTPTGANSALINANQQARAIYGFRQETKGGTWKYLGLLRVLDYIYIRKNGFMTYEFHFAIVQVNPKELKTADEALDYITQQEPMLVEETTIKYVPRRSRSAAFSEKIKKIYENRCAICKKKRLSVTGYPEVEAAHIYPKELEGADDLRNGLALCKLHHWAFDAGLITISDSRKVVVHPSIAELNDYIEIADYDDTELLLPNDFQFAPHDIYIQAHRELHSNS